MKDKLLLLLLTLLPSMSVWGDVVINEQNFPDENFRNYILSWDIASDGVLTDAEIAEVTYVSVYKKRVKNLQGIEFFTALTSLDCRENYDLTSLDLSNNTALETLNCSYTRLTTLNVSGCMKLIELTCNDAGSLSSLDLSNRTALISLQCLGCSLSSLDVSGCTALEYLSCPSNQLTTLDVSGCTALGNFDCTNNRLTALDLSKNAALIYINCSGNLLTTLDVSACTSLTNINCSVNQIKDTGMDALIESLPTVEAGRLSVIYNRFGQEKNEITTLQVAAAKAKGWTAYYWDAGTWTAFESESDGIQKIGASKGSNDSIIYNLSGQRIDGRQNGLNIVNGRKVLVKKSLE